jgi:hypothetical protein
MRILILRWFYTNPCILCVRRSASRKHCVFGYKWALDAPGP